MAVDKVQIVANEDGTLINVYPNSPEYGWIRVMQTVPQISPKGWLRYAKRFGFLKGTVEDLQKGNFQVDQELPGKIVVKESLFPFDDENPDKNIKVAGKTGIVCRVDDQPIYRQTFYTTDLHAVDEFITHTNSDEIKEVQDATRTLESLSDMKAKEELVEF